MKPLTKHLPALLTFTLAASLPSLAVPYQWDQNGSDAGLGGTGAWDTTSLFWDTLGSGVDDGTDPTVAVANWNPGTAVDAVTFGGTADIVTLGAAVNVLGTSFTSTAYTLNLTNTAATNYRLGTITGNATINVSLGSGATTADFLTTDWSGYTGILNIGVSQAVGSGKAAIGAAAGKGLSSSATVNITANSTLYASTLTTHTAALTLNGGDTGETLGQLRLDTGGTWSGGIILAGAMTGTDSFIGSNSGINFITGIIGESGGSRTLSKGGGGTIVLSGANTYTGGTILRSGTLAVTSIGNVADASSPLGNGGTFNIAANATLAYWGAGETTDRVVTFSTSAGGTITAHGNVNFSSNMTGAAAAMGVFINGGGNSLMNGITNTTALLNFNKSGLGIWTVNGSITPNGGNIRQQGGILAFSATSATTGDAIITSANRANNGVIRFATGSSIKSASINNNGILGAWATFDNTTWAKTNGTGVAIDGLSTFTDDTWATGNNTNVTLAGANPASGSITNSLRITEAGAKTLTLAGTNTIASGGIMVTSNVGANATTITGGTLTTSGANVDLVLNQFNTAENHAVASLISNNVRPARTGSTTNASNSITGLSDTSDLAVGMLITGTGIPTNATITAINSATQITISANATVTGTPSLSPVGVTALTKTGSGTALLSGANTYTGTTRVFEGTLRVTGNNGVKFYEVGSQGRLELDIDGGTSGYGRGVLVNGAGLASTNGLYLAGGRNFNFQSSLTLAGNPTTVRQFGTGNAILHGWDNNGTHLTVDSSASGSVIGTSINFTGGGFGYVMNIAPGLQTATGDVTFTGILTGSTVFRKNGAGSVRLDGVGSSTNTGALDVRQGTVILAGANNRLGSGSNVILGNGTTSGMLLLEGVNQTVTAITTAGTGLDNRVVGNSPTVSILTINNASDTTLAAALGGSAVNNNQLALTKSGLGALTLSGANSFIGNTTVSAGGLRLDYTSFNNSKLSDTGTLTLGGALILNGGTHQEIVGQTIITTNSTITRATGTATINLGAISRTGAATLNISEAGIATTSTTNDLTGRLPNWITVNSLPAANDGAGNIIVYTPTFVDVTRLGGLIPNNSLADVRIIDGGTTGPVTLAGSGTSDILSLTQNATSGPVTIDIGDGNSLRLGELGSITSAVGASSLTMLGGTLTAGATIDTPGTLAISGDSNMTIDSMLINNGAGAVRLVKSGNGILTLTGENEHGGGITLNAGQLQIGNVFCLGLNTSLTLNGGSFDNTTGAALVITDSVPQVWGGDFSYLGTHDLAFQSGGVNVTGNRQVTVAASTLDIRSAVSGGTGFTKLGAGTLLLSSAGNNWNGNTTVTNGVLEITATASDRPYTINPSGTLRIGYTTGANYANTNLKINGDGVAATTGLYLRGGSSYNASGMIELLTAPTTIRHYGTGLAAIGMFDINGDGITASAAASGSVIDENIQMVSRGFGMSMNIAAGTANATGDLINNGPLNVSNLGFYKRGTGSLRLNGVATTGNLAVQIQGGRVIAGVAGALGVNANLPISAGASLALNGFSQAALNLSGAGSVINGSATAATLSIQTTADQTFSGVLGGAGTDENNFAFTKSGTFKLTLSGANSYGGDTSVDQGTLTLTQAYLADGSAVRIATGASIELTHGSQDTIASLFINGVQQPAGTYTAANSAVIAAGSTGSLFVTTGPVSNPFNSWLTSNGITPGGPNTAPDDDFDADGMDNMVEYVLNSDPDAGNQSNLPQAVKNGGELVFTFTRLKEAGTAGYVSSVEYSPTLNADWTTAIPAMIAVTDNGLTENVVVTIPIPNGADKMFARLKVTKAP